MLEIRVSTAVLVCKRREVYRELSGDVSTLVELDTEVLMISLPEDVSVCRIVVRNTVEEVTSCAALRVTV